MKQKSLERIFSSKFTLTACFIIFCMAVIAFLPSFTSSFHFDDYDQIVNAKLKNISAIQIIKTYPATRWFVFFSFKANASLHGYNVFGYHLVNFIIHLI